MIDKNIFFVGYFLGIDNKMKFTDLFESKSKFFLESSRTNYLERVLEGAYFPEKMYDIHKNYSLELFKMRVTVDSLTRKMYRRDLKDFCSSYRRRNVFSKKMGMMLFLVYSALFVFEFAAYALRISQNFNKRGYGRALGSITKSLLKLDADNRSVALLLFRIRFLIGYKYALGILKKIRRGDNDLFIMWGREYSSRLLLIDFLEKKNIPYYIAEYGELPGTISCNRHGIFGNSDPALHWDSFSNFPLKNEDIEYAENILRVIETNQISIKTYGSNMFFLLKYFYNNALKVEEEKRQKIVYVNGIELMASGAYFSEEGKKGSGRNPNSVLLGKVVDFFYDKDYIIIYKDHPMTYANNRNAMLNNNDFPTVHFVNSMNIHDILSLSDMVVSLPSKVIMTSLMYKKKTFVFGRFTIPYSIPSMNYFSSDRFEDIKAVLNYKATNDTAEYTRFIARLIQSHLLIYDEKLFYHYQRSNEQKKLERILVNV